MKNKQNIKNKQKNISINAGGDVNTGVINNQIDNSWYNVDKENTTLLDFIGKTIISKLGEKGGFFSGLLLCVLGLILTISKTFTFLESNFLLKLFDNGGISLKNLFSALNVDWFFIIFGALIFGLGVLIMRSINHKNNRICPSCKKEYSLIEIGNPKEKEIKTSKGYRITQIRNYKCKNCKFKKTEESNFLEPINKI